jgi:hypothetical protein
MRSTYWTCTPFADWLRGTKSPKAETSKGWKVWKKNAKEAHPWRYWLADEALGTLQDIWMWVPDRINDVRYYIHNRWLTKTHALSSNLEKGVWHEFEERMLHGSFDTLVDFVEIDTAWSHVMWSEEAREEYKVPWWRKQWWSRWFQIWRCPAAGIAHLEWASTLTNKDFYQPTDPEYGKPTQQAKTAMEVLKLYWWWKEERPYRPDPHDASGWTAICDRRRSKDPDDILGGLDDRTPEEERESKRALDKCHKIEAQYEKEDEQMLIRLVKIRKSLWT